MALPVQTRHEERCLMHHFGVDTGQNEWYKEDYTTDDDAHRQHIRHTVFAQRDFLTYVISAQTDGGQKG